VTSRRRPRVRGSRSHYDLTWVGDVWLLSREALWEAMKALDADPDQLHLGRVEVMGHADGDDALRLGDVHVGVVDWSSGPDAGTLSPRLFDGLYGGLQQAQEFFGQVRFPLAVYRGLRVGAGERVRVDGSDGAGPHWSPRRQVAEAFADGRHVEASSYPGRREAVLLRGVIEEPTDISWRSTINHFLGYSVAIPQYFDPNARPPWEGDPAEVELQVTSPAVGQVRVEKRWTPRRKGLMTRL
jgi:hypothetical protein